MNELRCCHECARHVRLDETNCPFCGTGLGGCAPRLARAPRKSRSALLAVGAAAAISVGAECGNVEPAYGAPVPPYDAEVDAGPDGGEGHVMDLRLCDGCAPACAARRSHLPVLRSDPESVGAEARTPRAREPCCAFRHGGRRQPFPPARHATAWPSMEPLRRRTMPELTPPLRRDEGDGGQESCRRIGIGRLGKRHLTGAFFLEAFERALGWHDRPRLLGWRASRPGRTSPAIAVPSSPERTASRIRGSAAHPPSQLREPVHLAPRQTQALAGVLRVGRVPQQRPSLEREKLGDRPATKVVRAGELGPELPNLGVEGLRAVGYWAEIRFVVVEGVDPKRRSPSATASSFSHSASAAARASARRR